MSPDCLFIGRVWARDYVASLPGSCAGEEEREPGTHYLCMLSSLGNLHTTVLH